MSHFLLNLRVGTRLAAAFGALLVIALLLGGVALRGMGQIQQRMDDIVQVNDAKFERLQSMLDGTRQVAILMRNSVLRDDPAYAQAQILQLKALRERFEADRVALEKMPTDDKRALAMRAQTYEARDKAKRINDEILKLAESQYLTEARELLVGKGHAAMEAWAAPLHANMQLQVENNATDFAQAQAGYRSTRAMMLGLVALALVLGLGLSVLITRSLVRPLAQAGAAADDIAQGRLDGNLEVRGKDEVAALLGAMRAMQSRIRAVLSAQSEMERQHEAGAISYRVDAAAFPGEFGKMVAGANQLVTGHIET